MNTNTQNRLLKNMGIKKNCQFRKIKLKKDKIKDILEKPRILDKIN